MHSPVVSRAADGTLVFGPRGLHGKLLTARDLDACSGHTHKITIGGKRVRLYHYHRVRGHTGAFECPGPGAQTTNPPQAAEPSRVSIYTNPSVLPEFNPTVSDYVVRCADDPVQVNVSGAGPNESVSVDGDPPVRGDLVTSVPLLSGQAFDIETNIDGTTRDYHIRCLPDDFPGWTFDRLGQPRHKLYLTTPDLRWVVIFDDHGAPIWWYRTPVPVAEASVLSHGEIAWGRVEGLGFELLYPDGTLQRRVVTVGSPEDWHDMREVGNGDFLLQTYKQRDHVDLSPYGGSADTPVLDAEVQEIDPLGNLAWSWNSKDHISLDETPARWWPTALGFFPVDMLHLNSMEISGNSLILSMRHADAVYSISRTTGDIEWKLGGTPTPESLTVLNDPYAAQPLGGQHDARILSDDTLTVHDNGTGLRPPRAVRYAIDPVAGTATLLESVSDPEAPNSGCCGSARRSSDGSWLMAWGGTPLVTEFAPDGARLFRLTVGGPFPLTYRVIPVSSGSVTKDQLRTGMTKQRPR